MVIKQEGDEKKRATRTRLHVLGEVAAGTAALPVGEHDDVLSVKGIGTSVGALGEARDIDTTERVGEGLVIVVRQVLR